LNPLTKSHTANTISCTAIGIIRNIAITSGVSVNTYSMVPVNIATAAKRPQIDNHRGTSFDLYNTKFNMNAPMAKMTT